MAVESLSESQLRRLHEVGRWLMSELDIEALLEQILGAAKEMTRAKYGALVLLDESGSEIDRFLTAGIDETTRRDIGPLPAGRGVLGEVLKHPEALRLDKIGDHPRSYGFPPGHPPMESFLGVAIQIRGKTVGSIYLTEKTDGRFSGLDEAMLTTLAGWASAAIENARLYEENESRRRECERAIKGLEASVALSIVRAVDTDLDALCELISKRARALVESKSLILLLPGADLDVNVGSFSGEISLSPDQIVRDGNTLLQATSRDGLVHRAHGDILDLSTDGQITASTALVVNLDLGGHSQGYLVALDPLDRDDFNADDELLFKSFAISAASSLATARDVERERLRMRIDASEQERRRWSMELHDDTLQDLGALKLIAEGALTRGDPVTMRATLSSAASQLTEMIHSLESLIQELRPASLDSLGLSAAVESLVQRTSDRGQIVATTNLDLAHERGDSPYRLEPHLEATVYRVVQESLNNIVKHAEATKVSVSIVEADDEITIFVEDDGKGFDPAKGFGHRFGLNGVTERVELVNGSLEIDSTEGVGTNIDIRVPVSRQQSASENR